MQRFDDLNRQPVNSSVANSGTGAEVASFNASGQRQLGDIGGELLVGSGFENEEPESEFAARKEEG